MGRGKLTPEEIRILRASPYVADVNERCVSYSNEFKKLFIDKYMRGQRPTEIFREAGFDVKILGSKRIERACARWKESYKAGTLGVREAVLQTDVKYGDQVERKKPDVQRREKLWHQDIGEMGDSGIEICRKQAKLIKQLRAENEMLKRICGMMADEHGRKPTKKELCRMIRDVTADVNYSGCAAGLCRFLGISGSVYYSNLQEGR